MELSFFGPPTGDQEVEATPESHALEVATSLRPL